MSEWYELGSGEGILSLLLMEVGEECLKTRFIHFSDLLHYDEQLLPPPPRDLEANTAFIIVQPKERTVGDFDNIDATFHSESQTGRSPACLSTTLHLHKLLLIF